MSTQICKITFPDGAWLKAELPTGDERIEYVLDNFGMFSAIDHLPESDPAVRASRAKTMTAPGFKVNDKVLVNEGLFRGCKGVVFDVEPGDSGLTWVRVFVASQDRWTRQPYADSDLKLDQRLIDGAYVAA